jgi:hypothetical protein
LAQLQKSRYSHFTGRICIDPQFNETMPSRESGNCKSRDSLTSKRGMLSKAVYSSCSRMLAKNDAYDEDQSFEFGTNNKNNNSFGEGKHMLGGSNGSLGTNRGVMVPSGRRRAEEILGGSNGSLGTNRGVMVPSGRRRAEEILGGSNGSLGTNRDVMVLSGRKRVEDDPRELPRGSNHSNSSGSLSQGSNHSRSSPSRRRRSSLLGSFRKSSEDDPQELSHGSNHSRSSPSRRGRSSLLGSFRKSVEDDSQELSRGSNHSHSSATRRRSSGFLAKMPSFRKSAQNDNLTSAETLAILLAQELELCD